MGLLSVMMGLFSGFDSVTLVAAKETLIKVYGSTKGEGNGIEIPDNMTKGTLFSGSAYLGSTGVVKLSW